MATAKMLWSPAVDNHGGFRRWDFIEIRDPCEAQQTLRDFAMAPKETP